MKKITTVAPVLCLLSTAAFADTFTGVVSDAKCGAQHTALKPADQACIQKCLDAGSEGVLVSGDKVYKVTVQQALKTFAGQKVAVVGTLKGDTIDLESVMKIE
jgi:hypothetical protein